MAQGTARQNALSSRHSAAALALAFIVCGLLPDLAFANQGTSSPMGSALCVVVGIAMGNLGRALATLAVIFLGVGATLGKISWGLALTVATGIAVTFSAPWIVVTFLSNIGGYSGTAGGPIGCGGIGGVNT